MFILVIWLRKLQRTARTPLYSIVQLGLGLGVGGGWVSSAVCVVEHMAAQLGLHVGEGGGRATRLHLLTVQSWRLPSVGRQHSSCRGSTRWCKPWKGSLLALYTSWGPQPIIDPLSACRGTGCQSFLCLAGRRACPSCSIHATPCRPDSSTTLLSAPCGNRLGQSREHGL